MQILDGKKLKQEILENLKKEIKKIENAPTLCVIQIGNDEASTVYIKQKQKMCEFVGYNFIHKKFENNIEEEKLLAEIEKMNNDKTINAILVQMPIPKHLDTKKIQNKVSKFKDVDGLNDQNIINLINKKKGLFPCTASGIVKLLKEYKIPIEGSNVVIIGRSFLVGTPLFFMLENLNATVTLCHSKTTDLKNITQKADILIVAVGKKHLIKKDMIKENSIIIDVGINKVDNKLYGDVDFDNVQEKAKMITPVPGGVGPMTIAILAENILNAYKIQKDVN